MSFFFFWLGMDFTYERKYAIFVWLYLLNMMISRSTHFPANYIILFFFMAE
jgi:hypothetical protein